MINYKYCPFCRGNLEPSPSEKKTLKCTKCLKRIHLNSSPTASVLPIKGNKVLLAIRAIEPQKGKFDAIGGFLGLGEHPKDGVIREAKEETCLKVKLIYLLGVYMDDYLYQGSAEDTLNFYYIGKIGRGRVEAKEDVASLQWVPIGNPPKMAFFPSKKSN